RGRRPGRGAQAVRVGEAPVRLVDAPECAGEVGRVRNRDRQTPRAGAGEGGAGCGRRVLRGRAATLGRGDREGHNGRGAQQMRTLFALTLFAVLSGCAARVEPSPAAAPACLCVTPAGSFPPGGAETVSISY